MNESIKNGNREILYPPEFQKFRGEFRRLVSDAMERIYLLPESKQKQYLDLISEKQQKAFSSVTEPHRYVTYHEALAGGTDAISSPHHDFEGENSLMCFYKNLLEELRQLETIQ